MILTLWVLRVSVLRYSIELIVCCVSICGVLKTIKKNYGDGKINHMQILMLDDLYQIKDVVTTITIPFPHNLYFYLTEQTRMAFSAGL